MSLTMPSTITGVNIASLSSMVVNLTTAASPDVNAKKAIISSLASGTAASVRFHSVSDPWDLTSWAPKAPKALPPVNSITGVRPSIPMNTYNLLMRKGLIPASGEVAIPSTCQLKFDVPAGSESYDSANLAAMLSAMAGALNVLADDLYDNAKTGSN